ncbi:MAG: lipid-A-disaccharide synthase [Candidatus Omnitrophica bacterium]|nr:lipid-A-disaccharide synthase [Candidatus Omnitrophota bacterium]
MARKKILIVAGEPSGDLHASNLAKNLLSIDPDLVFYGLGGERSKKAGVEVIFDISGLALVGVIEVVKNIFTVGKAFRAVLSRIDLERPDLAVLVDYPGFNLRLAKALKKRSIPVVYYISPQVWVWGADRIGIIKDCVKKILVFFKFEEDLYKKHGVNAEFIGHPLVESVHMGLSRNEAARKFGLSAGKRTIALLPGSRRMEVENLLPIMAKACRKMSEDGLDAQYLVAKHPELDIELYQRALAKTSIDARIVDGDTYNIIGVSDFAIVASGTATLETAIIGTPLVVIYKTNPLTAMIARLVANVKILGLVNILAGREIAPEFLQENATPEKIAAGVKELLSDDIKLARMREELARVKDSLGGPGASARGASAVYEVLKNPK